MSKINIIEMGKVIVNFCIDNAIKLNTRRLENILFIIQAEYLNKFDELLFEDDMFAEKHGIYIPIICRNFSNGWYGFKEKEKSFLLLRDDEKAIIKAVMARIADETLKTMYTFNVSESLTKEPLSKQQIKSIYRQISDKKGTP